MYPRIVSVFPRVSRLLTVRSLSHQAATVTDEEDRVRSAIHSMILERKTTTDLDQSLHRLHNQLQEASYCVQDCIETENIQEEIVNANHAIEMAASTFVDFIETLRALPQELQEPYKTAREESASEIKELRQKLESFDPQA